MAPQKVLVLAGWSGSGKTTLLTALIPLLTARGLRVSTAKHAHHSVDPDQPGKDSHRHRQAGAAEVMLATSERFVLFHEHRGSAPPYLAEPDLAALISRMAPVDLILAEGFKSARMPKLEIHRPALGKPPLWPNDPHIIAVAADADLPGCSVPVLDLGMPAMIERFIMDRFALQ